MGAKRNEKAGEFECLNCESWDYENWGTQTLTTQQI